MFYSEQQESIVELKGLTTSGALPRGVLSEGRRGVEGALQALRDAAAQGRTISFGEARSFDRINERRPPIQPQPQTASVIAASAATATGSTAAGDETGSTSGGTTVSSGVGTSESSTVGATGADRSVASGGSVVTVEDVSESLPSEAPQPYG